MAGDMLIRFTVADVVHGSLDCLDDARMPPVRFTIHRRVPATYSTSTPDRNGNEHFYSIP